MSELENPTSLCTMWGECNCEYHNTTPLLRSSSTSTICNSPSTDSELRPTAAAGVICFWLTGNHNSLDGGAHTSFICFSPLYSHEIVSIKWVLLCADIMVLGSRRKVATHTLTPLGLLFHIIICFKPWLLKSLTSPEFPQRANPQLSAPATATGINKMNGGHFNASEIFNVVSNH